MDPSKEAKSDPQNEERSSILKRLEDYGNLVSQCNRFALLEKNAEQNRHTVRPHIYARVKNEYAEKRGELDQRERQQSEILRAQLDTVLDERKELNERCRHQADHLEELDFRVRVGEFAEEEVDEERRGLKEELLQVTKALADTQEVVNKSEQIGLLAQAPRADTADEEKKGEEEASSEGHHDFLVLEEDPSSADDESPVVTRPPGSDTQGSPIDHVTGYLVALGGSRRGHRFPLVSSNITVGSSPDIDIRLADAGIARLHARIVYKNGRHYLETVDASKGCLVNGIQIDKAELKDGDVLCLGETKMVVEYAHEANA
jgi:hypothetical protein